MKMLTQALVLFASLLAGCAPALDLSPLRKALASDPQWIREFDNDLMVEQEKAQNSHTGSIDSRIILWEDLNCMRGIYIAQARAAQAISENMGTPIAEAMNATQADPAWIIALQGCD